jgi:hypothetical protein
VGLHPCEEHNEERGWFRLVFSQGKDVLEVWLKKYVDLLEVILSFRKCSG